MKVLLLLFPLVLGNPIQEQPEVGSAEDAAILQQMVQDLFSERNGREIDVDDEETEASDLSTNLASSEPIDEKQAATMVQESDPIEIARFNNYMDAIYRRMNAALRAKLMDPMILNLDGKKKSNNNEKKGKREGREEDHEISKRSADLEEEMEVSEVDRIGEAEAEEDEEEKDVEEGEGRKLAKRGNKGKKKGGKKNKSKLTEEERKKKKEDRMKHKKTKGKKKHGNKKGKKNNKGKKEDAENKKAHKGKKEARKEKHDKHEDKEETLTRSRRNKHSKDDKSKGKKSHKKSNDVEDLGKSMGSLSGIATLRRSNDVVVMNSENYKVVKSDFSIGPLQLEVSKTFGKGKSRSVKTAKAVTEELAGKMVLKVKPDGSAHVKSVFFHKPEKVEVRGSLGSKKRRSDTYLKNSVGKVRPMAAQRILKMARYVLKSPSTVERS